METSTLCNRPILAFVATSVLFSDYLISHIYGADYCQLDTYAAHCANDEVLMITNAQYGRMKQSRCIDRDYGFIGCHTNVISHMDALCSGQQQCSILIPHVSLDASQPCPKDLKAFLRVEHTCIKVVRQDDICVPSSPLYVSDTQLFISNALARSNGRGSENCPWIVRTDHGRLINVTLWDFRVLDNPVDLCTLVYATVRDRDTKRTFTLCNGNRRQKHIMTSLTSELELRIVHSLPKSKADFLIQFEAIGCGDPKIEESFMWMKRESHDVAYVGCKDSSEKSWQLICNGKHWEGKMDNCSHFAVRSMPSMGQVTPVVSRTMAVAAIIIISVIFGVTILVAGVLFINRRRRHSNGNSRHGNMYRKQDKFITYQPTLKTNGYDVTAYQVPMENEYAYIADVVNTANNYHGNNRPHTSATIIGSINRQQATNYDQRHTRPRQISVVQSTVDAQNRTLAATMIDRGIRTYSGQKYPSMSDNMAHRQLPPTPLKIDPYADDMYYDQNKQTDLSLINPMDRKATSSRRERLHLLAVQPPSIPLNLASTAVLQPMLLNLPSPTSVDVSIEADNVNNCSM